jgi:allophanate hydrolase subunit 1
MNNLILGIMNYFSCAMPNTIIKYRSKKYKFHERLLKLSAIWDECTELLRQGIKIQLVEIPFQANPRSNGDEFTEPGNI